MKLVAKIGDCVVEIDDGNASEPASVRWKDQFERIVEVLHEAEKTVIAMHKQQTSA